MCNKVNNGTKHSFLKFGSSLRLRKDMSFKTCSLFAQLLNRAHQPVFKRETNVFGCLINLETVFLCDT